MVGAKSGKSGCCVDWWNRFETVFANVEPPSPFKANAGSIIGASSQQAKTNVRYACALMSCAAVCCHGDYHVFLDIDLKKVQNREGNKKVPAGLEQPEGHSADVAPTIVSPTLDYHECILVNAPHKVSDILLCFGFFCACRNTQAQNASHNNSQ